MHLKVIEQKKKALNNILLKVNNEKNIFLIKIMKLNQQLGFHTKNAVINRNLILSLQQKYDIKNDLLSKKSFFIKKWSRKNLWIYITEEQKYSTDSYSRYENTILKENKNSKDDFITIGEQAKSFCQKNKFNILKSYAKNNFQDKEIDELFIVIKMLYLTAEYSSVRFVINSNKNYDSFFTILPINEFDFDKFVPYNTEENSYLENLEITKFKIYPNINEFVNTELNIFIQNAINALICESSFYSAKSGLVTTNKIIKEIDEQKNKLSRQIARIKNEKEIEELSLLTRNKKTFEDM